MEEVETPATVSCSVCKDKYFCDSHGSTHGGRAQAQAPRGPYECPEHPGMRCFRYCVTHDRVVCGECCVDHPPGELHDVRQLDELHNYLGSQVTAALPELAAKAEIAAAVMQRVAEYTEALTARATASFDGVNSVRARLHAVVDHACDDSLKRGHTLLEARTKQLEGKVRIHLLHSCLAQD